MTCYQAQIRSLDVAFKEISAALTAAVTQRKPVYISIPVNLAAASHPSFAPEPLPFSVPLRTSSPGQQSCLSWVQPGRHLYLGEVRGKGAGANLELRICMPEHNFACRAILSFEDEASS